MSKVVQFNKIGGPEVLEVKDVEVPAPGVGQVRIKIKAIGLNRAEVLFRTGQYFEQPAFPAKLGYEAAGTIDAVGPEANDFKVGDVVSVVPNFSMNAFGMYADTAVVPVNSLVRHPSKIPFEEAASIWMAYLTAYDALIDTAKLRKGEYVVIPAASSSVGIASIQIANALGAVPIAFTRTSKKARELAQVGAAHVVATEEQDIIAELKRITDGTGPQVIFDPVGGPNFAKLLEAAAPKARIMLYGTLGEPTVVPHFPVFTKGLVITGALLFSTTYDPEKLKAGTDWILQRLESGELRPVIAKTFPLDQIVEAHRYLESNQQFGKIVITV